MLIAMAPLQVLGGSEVSSLLFWPAFPTTLILLNCISLSEWADMLQVLLIPLNFSLSFFPSFETEDQNLKPLFIFK